MKRSGWIMTIAVIYGGSRQNGNSETLTDLAIQGLEAEKLYLRDLQIQPIIDGRHAKEGFRDVADDYNFIIDRILPHDTLVFSTPIYWYSMSGMMKTFIDRWSQTLRDANYPDFRRQMAQKKAYVIAVGGDDPNVKGLPMIQQFQHIFDFMGISFEGYILGEGNKPEDILDDKNALYAAGQLQKKLKD